MRAHLAGVGGAPKVLLVRSGPMLASIVAATSLLAPCAALAPSSWQRGEFGRLAVASDGSMSFSFGSFEVRAAPPNGTAGTKAGVAGTDPELGPYDELLLPAAGTGGFAVKYFERLDAFTFERHPDPEGAPLDATFPKFDQGSAAGINGTAGGAAAECMGWSNRYFFPGGESSLGGCEMHFTDGPLFVFEPLSSGSTTTAAALALSPLLNFTLATAELDVLGVTAKRAAQGSTALLLARPGFVRASRALGSVLRQAHRTRRLRGIGTEGLSYWNDNQAGYSWW